MSEDAETPDRSTNVRILRTMFRYLAHEVSPVTARRFLDTVGIDEKVLNDENEWIDFETYMRAWDVLRSQTQDPAVAFKVGRFLISRANLGSLWPIVRTVAWMGRGTAAGYRFLPRAANQMTRMGRYEIESLSRRRGRFRWIQFPQYRFDPAQCDYRRGLMVAGPLLGDLPPARVDEVQCIGRGDPECVYEIRFPADRAVAGFRIGVGLGAVSAAIVLGTGQGWLLALVVLVAPPGIGAARDARNQLAYNNVTMSDQLAEITEAKRRIEDDYERLRQTQQQLRERERLASLGELSAKVAHELRNPLGIIKGSAQVLSDRSKASEVKEELTRYILDEVDRMNSAITNFLVFARPKVSHRSAVGLGAAMERLLVEWKAQGEDHVSVVYDPGEGVPDVMVDPHQLHQALLNLVLNAADAMRDSGRVTVRTRSWGEHVRIEVADEGPGFGDEALGRGFEAFYTTKEYGTGLGLTNVSQMVEANGGRVTLGNGSGGGAVVTIDLEPVQRDAGTGVANPRARAEQADSSGGGR